MTANLKSLSQKRADFAYKAVLEVKEESKEVQKKYSSYVKSAPALILSNGLPASLAFYFSKMKIKSESDYKAVQEELKKEDKFENKAERIAYAYLYTHISEWLAEKTESGKGLTNGKDPLKYLIEDATVYDVMRLSREALELLNWLKRFADAMLEKEEES